MTIVGESAGAGSVSAHLLSPHSRGYFHQAIMQVNELELQMLNVYISLCPQLKYALLSEGKTGKLENSPVNFCRHMKQT